MHNLNELTRRVGRMSFFFISVLEKTFLLLLLLVLFLLLSLHRALIDVLPFS